MYVTLLLYFQPLLEGQTLMYLSALFYYNRLAVRIKFIHHRGTESATSELHNRTHRRLLVSCAHHSSRVPQTPPPSPPRTRVPSPRHASLKPKPTHAISQYISIHFFSLLSSLFASSASVEHSAQHDHYQTSHRGHGRSHACRVELCGRGRGCRCRRRWEVHCPHDRLGAGVERRKAVGHGTFAALKSFSGVEATA